MTHHNRRSAFLHILLPTHPISRGDSLLDRRVGGPDERQHLTNAHDRLSDAEIVGIDEEADGLRDVRG